MVSQFDLDREPLWHVYESLDAKMRDHKSAHYDKTRLSTRSNSDDWVDYLVEEAEIVFRETLSGIEVIVKENPECVAEVNELSSDCSPYLIEACTPYSAYKTVSSDLVRVLVQANPSAAAVKDCTSNTPLLRYCGGTLDEETVKLLIHAHPEAVYECNDKRDFPLHVLCENKPLESACEATVLKVIEMVMGMFPDALKLTNGKHETPLHVLCGYWVCAEGYEAAYLSVLKKMVDLCPEALRMQCRRGNTPLSIHVIENVCDSDVASLLMSKAPETIAYANYDGCTPLTYAASWRHDRILECMIRLYPPAVRVCPSGQPPIADYVSAHSIPVMDKYTAVSAKTLRVMIDVWPAAVLWRNETGTFPYDMMSEKETQGGAGKVLLTATKEALAALVESILDDKSGASSALKDLVCKAFPALTNKRGIVIWKAIQSSTLTFSIVRDIVKNDGVQNWIRKAKVDVFLCHLIKMKGCGHAHDLNQKQAVKVMGAHSSNADCLYHFVRNNPGLCRVSSNCSRKRKVEEILI